MVTPLINRLKETGGTLYTFTSAVNQLSKSFTNKNYEFTFSHFACLNLPNIKNYIDKSDDSDDLETGLYLNSLLSTEEFDKRHSSNIRGGMFSAEGMNVALAENIQNYVLNFEIADLNKISRINTNSEKIFFNWLQKVNAINFTKENVYIEDTSSVVQYIGTIDAINQVDILGDSYSEIYLYIPGNSGKTNNGKIKFNTSLGIKYMNVEDENSNNGKIIGRGSIGDLSPYGLSTYAIYDDKSNQCYEYDKGYSIDFNPKSYGDYNNLTELNNKYKEPFEFNCVLIYYTINYLGKSYINLYGVLFLEEISDIKVDTIGENFTEIYDQGYIQSYPKIAGDDSGNGNSFALKVDLKIDALPDNTMTSKPYSDPNAAVSMTMYMESLAEMQKCVSIFNRQQNEILKLQDKINYLENRLSSLDSLETINDRLDIISDSISSNEPTLGIIDWDKITEGNLNEVVEKLKKSNENTGIINGVNIKDLILENAKNINSIVTGKLNTKLQYNTDVIKNGYGINVSKNNNNIQINSLYSSYNIISLYTDDKENNEITESNKINLHKGLNEYNNIYLTLGECSNLALLYVDDSGEIEDYNCNSDIRIYINSNNTNWEKGQSLKIKIIGNVVSKNDGNNEGGLILPQIKIYNNNDEITSSFNVEYVKNHDNCKYIEIICIGENKFIYDITK